MLHKSCCNAMLLDAMIKKIILIKVIILIYKIVIEYFAYYFGFYNSKNTLCNNLYVVYNTVRRLFSWALNFMNFSRNLFHQKIMEIPSII